MKLMLNACTLVGVAVMAVLATQVKAAEVALVPLSSATSDQAPAPLRVAGVPGGKIPLTNFSMMAMEGRKVLRVATAKSYGNLVHDLPPGATAAGMRLNWRRRGSESWNT